MENSPQRKDQKILPVQFNYFSHHSLKYFQVRWIKYVLEIISKKQEITDNKKTGHLVLHIIFPAISKFT